MATISIAKPHQLTHRKAREVAEKIAQDLNERFDLEWRWNGDHVEFNRPGLNGRLHVGAKDLSLDVRLGLLLSALKPAIEKEIHAQLDRLLTRKA